MSRLEGYAAMPFIAATELRTGRWQLVFGGLVLKFLLVLLSGLLHRHDCLVENQPAVKILVFV